MKLHFNEVFSEINCFLDAQAANKDGFVRTTLKLSDARIPLLQTGDSKDASYVMLLSMKLGWPELLHALIAFRVNSPTHHGHADHPQ